MGAPLSGGALDEGVEFAGAAGGDEASVPLGAAPSAAAGAGDAPLLVASAAGELVFAFAGFDGFAFALLGVAAVGVAGLDAAGFAVAGSGVALEAWGVVPEGGLPESVAVCAGATARERLKKSNPPCFQRRYPKPPINARAIKTKNNLPPPRFGS